MKKQIAALILTAAVTAVNLFPAVEIRAQGIPEAGNEQEARNELEIRKEQDTFQVSAETGAETEYPALSMENLSYGWGYQQLGAQENGEALQEAYDRVVEAAWDFYYSDRDAEDMEDVLGATDENGNIYVWKNIAAVVDVSDLGLTWEDMAKIRENFDVDGSIFYFMYDAYGITLNWCYDEAGNIAEFYLQVSSYLDADTGEDLVDYTDGSKREAIRTIIEEKLQEYYDLTKDLSTDEEKERAIVWKIMEEVTYDDDKSWIPYNHNILGVLRNGMTVCEGYARTMQIVCNYCGVDCIYVEGEGNPDGPSESHAWNKVKLDGEWFDVDVTWQDGTDIDLDTAEQYYGISPYQFIEEEPEFMAYINMPHEIFAKSHTEDDKGYPTSSESEEHWSAYIMNAEENGSTQEEQTAACKAYLKEQLLKGNMTVGLLSKGLTYQYYQVFQPAFQEAAQEVKEETGRQYVVTPGYFFGSNSLFVTNDMDEVLMVCYVAFSEKKETDNSVYYVGNIPGNGIYLSIYSDGDSSIRQILPDSLEDRDVTVVEYQNLENKSQLVLPSNCICFGSYDGEQVVIPESLREINGLHQNIRAIYLPAGIRSIDLYALGYTAYTDTAESKMSDFTIYGYAGTKAESYAAENEFTFVDVTGKELIEQITISDIQLSDPGTEGAEDISGISLENASVESIVRSADGEAEITLTADEGHAFTPNTLFDIEGTPVSATLDGSETAVIRYTFENEEGSAPVMIGDSEVQGWEAIKEQIGMVQTGESLAIDMNGGTLVPCEVWNSVMGKDADISFALKNGAVWKVNGIGISSEQGNDIDLSVERTSVESGNIPADTITALAGSRTAEQLMFGQSGDLGFTGQLTLGVPSGVTGNKSILLQTTSDDGTLTYTSSAPIADNDITFQVSQGADSAVIYGINGDTNGDDGVDIRDLMQTLYHVSGRTELDQVQQGFADIDGNMSVNIQDLMRELYYVSGRNHTL